MKANASRIRNFRRQHGLTQLDLARQSGLSLRTIKTVEQGGSVGRRTLQALARIMRVRIPAILGELADIPRDSDVPRFLLQQVVPDAGDQKLIEILRAGAVADMQRRYADAASRFESALETIAADDLDIKAQLVIKCASAADNSGDSSRAIKLLEPMLTDRAWDKVKPWIQNWMRYHIALAYRRTAERMPRSSPAKAADHLLKHAEKMLAQVQTTGRLAQRISATHQLGCVHWARAQRTVGSHPRRHRAAAQRCFAEAARKWHKLGNFREGYALRRLADLAQQDGDDDSAHRLLLDALEVFVAHDCHRYRDEVRSHLARLFRRRGKAA